MPLTASIVRGDHTAAFCRHRQQVWRQERVSFSRYLRHGRLTDSYCSVISHHQRTRLSYHALDRDSNALAHGLANLGVKKGDRVAVSLGNNIEYATVCY